MKKSFMTRVLATGLSLAMAFSLSAATNVTTAEAATSLMRTTTKTLTEGQTRMTLMKKSYESKYRIKNTTRDADAKKIINVAKVRANKKGIDITAKKTAVTDAGLEQAKGVVTVNFVKKADANKKNAKVVKKAKVTVVVKAKAKPVVDETVKVTDVKQKTFTEFTATMSKALESVSASDFTMVRDNDNQVITVKSATLDATDKTKVSLVVYSSLTDAKTYTVTYTAADEAKTKSEAKVTVTDGTVAAVNITPTEITANKETLIEYQTLDANGVIVSQKGASKAESKVDVTWDSLLGTMDNETSKYILYNEGDTAKFTVTYHTYKYDSTTGAELGVITQDFTVTAVKDASVINQFAYTAAIDKPYDWSKVTPKTTIALGDDGSNSKQRTAYFYIKDAKNNNVTDTCGYTVESSDNSIVVADGNVKEGVKLNPVNKGSAFLMIKNDDGKVVNTLPITVGEKRTVSTFKLSAAVVNVVSSASFTPSSLENATCGYTDVTAKDQYGDDIAVDLDYENKTNNGVAEIELNAPTANSIRVTGVSVAQKVAGYDNYIIKGTDKAGKTMTTSLRVNSVEPKVSSATTYSVVFLDENEKVVSSVDTTIGENLTAAPATKTLTAVIVEMKGGVVVKALTNDVISAIKSVKVTKNDGTVIASTTSKAGIAVVSSTAISDTVMNTPVTGTGITANGKLVATARTSATNSVKNLGVGTYTVVYELEQENGTEKDAKASASFTVKDSQTAVIAKVKETNCGKATDIEAILSDSKNYVEYYYGDVMIPWGDITQSDIQKVDVKYSNSSNGGFKNAYVKSVTITVPVAGQSYTMDVVVPVNKTFTTSAQWSQS